MLTWSLIFLASVLAFVGILALAGTRLPSSHIAGCRARFRQSAQTVWGAISDFAALPAWRTDLRKVEKGEDRNGNPVWIEVSRQGRLPLEVEVFEPPRRMVTRIADPKLPFGGTWTFEIADTHDGTTLTITEHGEISNPIFRVMARYVFGYHGMLKRYLTALGVKFDDAVVVEVIA